MGAQEGWDEAFPNSIPRELGMDAAGPEAVLRGRFQLPLPQSVPTVLKMKDFGMGFSVNSSEMAHDKRNEDNVETDFFREAGAMIHGGKMHLVPVLALQNPEGRSRRASSRLGAGKAGLLPIPLLLA